MEGTDNKMSKRGFIKYLADKNHVTVAEAAAAYNMVIDGIIDVVRLGTKLSLMNFGVFYLQKHSGHPIQFKDEKAFVKDYKVFKFTASNVLNDSVRRDAVATEG